LRAWQTSSRRSHASGSPRQSAILDRIEPFGLFLIFGLLILEYYTPVRILSTVLLPLIDSVVLFFLELAGVRR
jgi:hypothetical protein